MSHEGQDNLLEPVKRGPGQPTKYDPKYCDLIIEHMSKGGSVESFPSLIHSKYGVKVSKQTVWAWAEAHDEFYEALEVGKSYLRSFLEQIGNAGMSGQLKRVNEEIFDKNGKKVSIKYSAAQFNFATWRMLMFNHFGYRLPSEGVVEDKKKNQQDQIIPPQIFINIPENGRDTDTAENSEDNN